MNNVIKLPRLFRRLTTRTVPAEVKPWKRRYEPEPQTQLSQRTFAKLILVHCQNLKVSP